ncbi:MAG: hypothetical protein LBU64_12220 [Planctomycetota bacterium]|jgi:nickel transport protein|nr:hypothetical protein [Planctomycetota bacterium]
MKPIPFALLPFAALLLLSGEGLAHKVSVFAFVDGDGIQVECGFSRSRKVKNGKLVVADLETGQTILEGVTDERGLFRFRPSDEFLASGHGLLIRLDAGEGHRDEWKISPEELSALSGNAGREPPARPGGEAGPPPGRPGPDSGGDPPPPPPGIEMAQLEAILERLLDAKLSPLKRALARQEEAGPGLREIVGGIGWILGLLGMAAYLKYRR